MTSVTTMILTGMLFLDAVESDFHHPCERGNPFVARRFLMGDETVGNGEESQSFFFALGSRGKEGIAFHLGAENAHVGPLLPDFRRVVVEVVGGHDLSDRVGVAMLFGGLDRLAKDGISRDGAICSVRQGILADPIGVGGGPLGDDDVEKLQLRDHGAGRADAYDPFDPVEVVELVAVDADRRHTHPGAHDGHFLAFVGPGVGKHVSDGVHEFAVRQKSLGDEFCTQRIAGHENGLGDFAFFGLIMGCGHTDLLSFDY